MGAVADGPPAHTSCLRLVTLAWAATTTTWPPQRYAFLPAGADAVDAFARQRNADLEARYAAQVAAGGDDVTARADALAAALTADGFAASTRPVEAGTPLAGVQLCQGHCPVQHVATAFPAFCDAETDAFSRLLGVHVQRLSTLAHGEHVCTTFIPMSAGPAKALKAPARNEPKARPSLMKGPRNEQHR